MSNTSWSAILLYCSLPSFRTLISASKSSFQCCSSAFCRRFENIPTMFCLSVAEQKLLVLVLSGKSVLWAVFASEMTMVSFDSMDMIVLPELMISWGIYLNLFLQIVTFTEVGHMYFLRKKYFFLLVVLNWMSDHFTETSFPGVAIAT